MGLFGGLLNTAIDIVLTPIDVVADVSDVLSGYEPKNTTTKVKKIAQGGADIIKDAINLDL